MNVNYDEYYYAEKNHWYLNVRQEIIINIIKHILNTERNSVVMDIGCGTGRILNEIKSPGLTLIGLDNANTGLKEAKENKNIDLLLKASLLSPLPIKDESADMILTLDVLEHIENDEEMIKRLYMALKKDGVILITLPGLPFLMSPHDIIYKHYRRYSKKYIENLLRKHGFYIVRTTYYNALLMPPILLFRIFRKVFKFKLDTSDFKMSFGFLDRIFRLIFNLEKYWLKKFNLPLGISLLTVAKKL